MCAEHTAMFDVRTNFQQDILQTRKTSLVLRDSGRDVGRAPRACCGKHPLRRSIEAHTRSETEEVPLAIVVIGCYYYYIAA